MGKLRINRDLRNDTLIIECDYTKYVIIQHAITRRITAFRNTHRAGVEVVISEAGTQTTQTPDAFLISYQRQMCADPTVKLMLTEGINYSITINDTRTGNQYQLRRGALSFDAFLYVF